jgi:hypothetical protein
LAAAAQVSWQEASKVLAIPNKRRILLFFFFYVLQTQDLGQGSVPVPPDVKLSGTTVVTCSQYVTENVVEGEGKGKEVRSLEKTLDLELDGCR